MHLLLELAGCVQNGSAGRDHVVDNDRVLAAEVCAQEFVRDDRILAINDYGVIPSFIEHTRIGTDHAGKIYSPVQRSLVGRDDDNVLFIHDQIRYGAHQGLQELIGRCEIAEIHEGIYILDPGIVGVKGDKILDAQIAELFVHDRAVQ